MKIALAIMGGPRFFSEEIIYKPIRKFILDAYDAQTFAAIYEPYSEREYDRSVWLYPKHSYFRHDFLEEFSKMYAPIRAMDCQVFLDELPRLVRESEDLPRSTGRKYCHRAVYSQFERWAKTAELIGPVEHEYDLVIKYRTDLAIRDWGADSNMLEAIAHSDKIYVSSSNGMGWPVGPHGEVHGGICETMWICKPEIHFRAVSIFNYLHQYGRETSTIHAEKLFGHHLKKLGIEVETFPLDSWYPDSQDMYP